MSPSSWPSALVDTSRQLLRCPALAAWRTAPFPGHPILAAGVADEAASNRYEHAVGKAWRQGAVARDQDEQPGSLAVHQGAPALHTRLQHSSGPYGGQRLSTIGAAVVAAGSGPGLLRVWLERGPVGAEAFLVLPLHPRQPSYDCGRGRVKELGTVSLHGAPPPPASALPAAPQECQPPNLLSCTPVLTLPALFPRPKSRSQ